MKKIIIICVFLLTGCLGDKIPWDPAGVRQSGQEVYLLAPGINSDFIYEKMKIQKSGEKVEFKANIPGQQHAKNRCLPLMGYKFISGIEYNVSFSVVKINAGERKVYAARLIYKY
ncbi:putative T6SS immunity periplasmic lipoprotein [Rahnella aceris]|uniref:putative T6SS immunity periplasmic lipoprotein n=1 Tax=Rahnella sp. (strain Y9602) TaxID=2703885 RepID=UPI003FD149E7